MEKGGSVAQRESALGLEGRQGQTEHKGRRGLGKEKEKTRIITLTAQASRCLPYVQRRNQLSTTPPSNAFPQPPRQRPRTGLQPLRRFSILRKAQLLTYQVGRKTQSALLGLHPQAQSNAISGNLHAPGRPIDFDLSWRARAT